MKKITTYLLIFFIVPAISIAQTIPANPVAYWNLDASSGTTAADGSGNNYSGTLNGCTWQPSGGQKNGALSFNGTSDYVNFSATAAGSSAALSVAFWMKTPTVAYQIPIDKLPGTGTAGWSVKMRNNNEIWIRIGSENDHTDLVVPNAYVANTWVNIAFTYENGKLALYINGKTVGTKSNIIQTTNNTNTALRFGKAVNSSETFSGLLDDVLIYNRALTLEEISALNGIQLNNSTRTVGDLTLWYDKEAGSTFTDALPIGNGRMGGMVYGNVAKETIGLNEGTVWSGNPGNNNKQGASNFLADARSKIFAGNYTAADATVANMISSGNQAFQPVGNLYLDFSGHVASNYYRELDLKTAVAKTGYTYNGVNYTREYFASYPDQTIIVRLTADQPGKITYTTTMDSPHTPMSISNSGNDVLILNGQADAINFQSRIKVRTEGGTITSNGSSITVTGANSSTVILAIGTNFNSYNDVSGDQSARAAQYISNINAKTYEQLLSSHLSSYKELFNRVSFNPGPGNSYSKYTTDIRVANFGFSDDPQLVKLYYQYGRYLMISCSRQGGQAANLQGVWNNLMSPPWGSNYTTNINTQMNYWMTETANLSECATPLIEKLKALVPQGQLTAQTHWGVNNGWVLHHNTDLWNHTAPVDGQWGLWPTGGAWLSKHLWEHYLFNQDKTYLADVYPTMKGSAQFFLSSLVTENVSGNNYLVTCPSTSPENIPSNGAWMSFAPTMDNQIIRDIFNSVLKASEILNIDATLRTQIQIALAKLPPNKIGKYGQLQEWFNDWDNPSDQNRHISHLYGLFPGNEITKRGTPALADAAKITLQQRGDLSTGWSLAWKINFWARQEDGNHSYDLIRLLITPERTYNNLFDAHPPFQIDGNFGAVSGINEMFLQSQNNEIQFLPALPDIWPAGSMAGLRARGGFIIDSLVWQNKTLKKTALTSLHGDTCYVRYKNIVKKFPTQIGVSYVLDESLNLVTTSNTAYNGTPAAIPGKIEAENYDNGGEGIAYHDNDILNSGGQQRTNEGVDIENSGDGTYNVGWTNSGEWMKYSVNVSATGAYTLEARIASPGSGNTFRVELDGVTISGSIAVPNTAGWQTYQTVSVTTPSITAGAHVLRIYEETGGFNINYLNFSSIATTPVITSAAAANGTTGSAFTYTITATNTPISYAATGLPAGLSVNTSTGVISGTPTATGTYTVNLIATNNAGPGTKALTLTITAPAGSTPYLGTPWPIPGKIEAENYDVGGEGIAYHDNDAINNGQFRTSEFVDAENCGEGTFDIGYTNAGEWMKYTVNVATTGIYSLQVRIASPGTGNSLRVELDGVNISGSIAVPNTTGWQTYQTVSVTTPSITAGAHVLRIYEETGGFNINYINFISNTAVKPFITSGITANATLGNNFSYTITASNTPTSFSAVGLPAGLSLNTTTGVISGTPVNSGTSSVTIGASNNAGQGTATLSISVTPAADPSGVITCYKVASAITVNGNLSETGWNVTRPFSKTVFGTPNNTATFGVLWDNTNLYVGVKVLDANLFADSPDWWEDDAVEIYIDANYNKLSSYDGFDNQIIKGYNKSGVSTKLAIAGLQHAWAAISGGYSIELAIPWSPLGITAPVAGTNIGFDLGYNDDDNGGSREGQAMWNGIVDNYQNTSAFGRLTLNSGISAKTGVVETEEAKSNNVWLFPSPVTEGMLTVIAPDLSDKVQIEIRNSLGVLVQAKTLKIENEQFEINVAELSSGSYFLKFFDDKNIFIEKFIVQ